MLLREHVGPGAGWPRLGECASPDCRRVDPIVSCPSPLPAPSVTSGHARMRLLRVLLPQARQGLGRAPEGGGRRERRVGHPGLLPAVRRGRVQLPARSRRRARLCLETAGRQRAEARPQMTVRELEGVARRPETNRHRPRHGSVRSAPQRQATLARSRGRDHHASALRRRGRNISSHKPDSFRLYGGKRRQLPSGQRFVYCNTEPRVGFIVKRFPQETVVVTTLKRVGVSR